MRSFVHKFIYLFVRLFVSPSPGWLALDQRSHCTSLVGCALDAHIVRQAFISLLGLAHLHKETWRHEVASGGLSRLLIVTKIVTDRSISWCWMHSLIPLESEVSIVHFTTPHLSWCWWQFNGIPTAHLSECFGVNSVNTAVGVFPWSHITIHSDGICRWSQIYFSRLFNVEFASVLCWEEWQNVIAPFHWVLQ